MTGRPLVELVEGAAMARKDAPIPRDYILDALEKIEKGYIEIEKYPTGHPSLKEVYDIASEMYEKDQLVN